MRAVLDVVDRVLNPIRATSRFGHVADVYMREKDRLLEGTEERRRVFIGHLFWPQEVLRDSLILAAMVAVLCFYSWLIPPPLHNAADPFAQAGFVFPDWYVLFSYGYLRWGEYLPQFTIPIGFIGDIFGQPFINWNAAWWGAFITGLPVGLLILPPFLGGREKRGVEDPWFAFWGTVYLGHVWFISVFSINIFLDLYGKNRTDMCKIGSRAELLCGVRQPWVAELFNAIPWVLTGILVWLMLYFLVRRYLVTAGGPRVTRGMSQGLAVVALTAAIVFSAVTWPIYDKGFWDFGGLGTIESYEDLEAQRTQPADVILHEDSEWGLEGETVTAGQFLQWSIYQPAQLFIIDFRDANGHQDAASGRNAATSAITLDSNRATSTSGTMTVTASVSEVTEVITDVGCEIRRTNRTSGEYSPTLTLTRGGETEPLVTLNDCETRTIELETGATYAWTFDFSITSMPFGHWGNATMSIAAFQPLILFAMDGDGNGGGVVNLSSAESACLTSGTCGAAENVNYHKNPKSLDAKLVYSTLIPPFAFGFMVLGFMRRMARGYEYEMNKCYGCDLCDDACPVRLFNAGDKLNIIYNTWNNEDDGVPMFSCLTCSACSNACPQLVDYDSYVDIRRNLIVGGPPATEIPHTVLQAVLAAEAEEEADGSFLSFEEAGVSSNVGYYPGCVDYLDQEMVFSHLNEGTMDLGATTTSAFTLFKEIGADVSYLGRDVLKCCGHDQKWQGMDEVFEKLKNYNQSKLNESGIDTLVTSCAECFRTFARDYELEDIKVMHTTEYLKEQGFDVQLQVEHETTVTYHDPCRMGRQMGIYDTPRDLVTAVEGVELVEMVHSGEDAMCCGVSSMMSCNENSRALRLARFEEVRETGADIMLTSCPKCVIHFECLKFEGDPKHDFEILDIVTFLARQVAAKRNGEAAEVATESAIQRRVPVKTSA